MNLPVVFEIVIGTAYTYFFFSLLTSGLNEVLARWTKARAKALERSIPSLLGTPNNQPNVWARIKAVFIAPKPPVNDLANAFFAHPLIDGIATDYRFPSYIPPAHFALALIDLTLDLQSAGGVLTASALPQIKGTTKALAGHQKQVVESLISGESNPRVIQSRMEQWFKDSADRISGAYKRAAYRSLFIIGLGISFGFGVNSIRLVENLYTDPATRQIAVDASKSATPTSAPKVPPIPIGREPMSAQYVLGCIVSALAITLGAPFWFELLNLFVNLRQTGSPPATGSKFTG